VAADEDARESQRILWWHEAVHHFFRETLYFFLLSMKGYTSYAPKELEGDLHALGVEGFCLYELYGPFDVLIRAWLNSETKARMDEYLENARGIKSFREFQVFSQVHWNWPDQDIADASTALAGIKEVGAELIRRAQDRDKKALQQAVVAKIAARLETSSNDKIKFFSLLVPTAVLASHDLQYARDLVEQRLQSLTPALADCSAYFGTGFAWAILSGRARYRDYYPTRDLLIDLADHLAVWDFAVVTFLVTKWNTYESDHISSSSFGRARPFADEIAEWVPELYAAQIDEPLLSEIEAFCLRVLQSRDKYDDDELDLVRELLIAKIVDSRERFIQPLAGWFIGTEAGLRASIGGLIQAAGLSEDMVKTFKERIRHEGAETALGSLFRLYSLVFERMGTEDAKRFSSRQFNEKSKAVAELRNDVMHGKFDKVYGNGWLDRLSTFADFLPILRGLTQFVAKVVSRGGEDAQ